MRPVALLRRPAANEDGFTIVELLIAITVLLVGILAVLISFVSSQQASLVAERESSMAHIAQQQIEFVQGIPYGQLAMSSSPGTSPDAANPDHYVVAGPTPSYQWDRTTASTEPLDIDSSTPGAVAPVQSWSEGRFSGQVYDFVTWTTDPRCAPACPADKDYKRITVAVTIAGASSPTPVYLSSILTHPPSSSTNPLNNPATTCTDSNGVAGQPCTSPIDSGNPNTYYLHDWPASGAVPQAPSADNATHGTVAALSGLLCTTSQLLGGLLANITGCPTPDLMDSTPPSAASTTLYHYSTDQLPDSSYPGGRIQQPLCTLGLLCSGSSGGGTGSPNDCSSNTGFGGLLNVQAGFWVSSPVTATTTLTGDGGISLFSQTVGGVAANVSFCLQIYDVPPSNGVAGSLSDILAWPPVALGGAGYVAPSNPTTSSNWPASPSQVSYIFNFRGSHGSVGIAAGHRIGVRLWFRATLNTALALLYDNPVYPSELQLNTQ